MLSPGPAGPPSSWINPKTRRPRRGPAADRHPESDLDALSEALSQVTALARAGLSGPEVWRPLLGQTGYDLDTWAASLKDTPTGPHAAAVAAIQRIAQSVGASTADLLDAVVKAVDQAQETDDAREAAIAGPKSSARLLRFLPLLGLLLGTAMGAQPVPILLGGGLGSIALGVGVGLMLLGQVWSSALVRSASRPAGTAALVAAVLAAALRAGLALPDALLRTGQAWGGWIGGRLAAVGAGLTRGQPWDQVWDEGWPDHTVTGRADQNPPRRLSDNSLLGGPPAPYRRVSAGESSAHTASTWAAKGVIQHPPRRLSDNSLLGGPPAPFRRVSAGESSAHTASTRPVGVIQHPPRSGQEAVIEALRSTLWLVWSAGVEAGPLLEAVAARFGRAERRRLSQAAARLGVYLMAPLGLCYLPAFVALGLVPIMLSLAGSLVQVM
ncbi:MAG: hypothetical protein LBJ62_05425 [Bifidobacteriaceae bacterium]|nr:hypothetical protein [Bifidobacteriaceae bacterium]